MNELSLFSGVGGGLLGSKLLGWRCIGYVEKDEYCQRVIQQRIRDEILDDAPIFTEIGTFIEDGYAAAYKGMVDVITAGFPCQPFSVAGKRKGEMDERNMWPATIETIRIVRPRFCLLENVPGLLAHEYFGTILRELSESGYDARWKVISAAEMGAPHKRDRLWIVANAKVLDGTWGSQKKRNWTVGRGQKHRGYMQWATRPKPCRMDDGLDFGVDRLKAIGNGQVPAVVRAAWEILTSE